MFRIAALGVIATLCLPGQTYPAFEDKLKSVMSRPEYRHARFGMAFSRLRTQE